MVAAPQPHLHAGSSESSRALCYAAGAWHEGNVALTGPMDHAFWMSSVVFDGARAFGGLAPDLDLHCRRLFESAATMGLRPKLEAETVIDLCRHGVREFPADAELYIRPAFYATAGFVVPDPESTEFALAVHEAPLPEASGFSACLSTRRRPSRQAAPTDAKASCLYPNVSLALTEARARGFESAVILDPNGNVAEFRDREPVVRPRRCRLHPGRERHLPRRHHPPADDRAVDRGRDRDGRARDLLR